MKNAQELLDAVADAAAVLNYAISRQEDGAPLSGLTAPLKVLSRAVARAEVLLTVVPDSPLTAPLSARDFTDEDRADRAATIAALEAALARPSAPVLVRLTARTMDDGSTEDAMRRWVQQRGVSFYALPDGAGYRMDVSKMLASIADQVLPPDPL